jgi:antitoxin component YwqK of YwqJK toxin-antitoxin module
MPHPPSFIRAECQAKNKQESSAPSEWLRKRIPPPGTYTVIRDENGTKYTGKLEVYYGNGKISWVSDYRCGVRVGRANGTSSKREIYGGVLDGEDNSLSIEFTDNGFIQQGNSSIYMTDKTKYKVERKVDITSTGFKWTTCVVNKDGSRTKVITGTATAD